MTILKINKKETQAVYPCIRDLDYGTFVTDVPAGKDSVYIKVKKKDPTDFAPDKLTVKWKSGYCILLNVSYGTFRQIPGETLVVPLCPELTVMPLKVSDYYNVMKDKDYGYKH